MIKYVFLEIYFMKRAESQKKQKTQWKLENDIPILKLKPFRI